MRTKANAALRASWLSLALASALLAGCGKAPSSPRLALSCPELQQYSREEQERAASELEQLPAGSMVDRLVQDYGALRDACRAAVKVRF